MGRGGQGRAGRKLPSGESGGAAGSCQVCSLPPTLPEETEAGRLLRGNDSVGGSLTESCLLGPRSPAPQLPASGGLSSLRDWVHLRPGCTSLGTVRHHLLGPRDLDNQCLLVSALGISLTPPPPLSSPALYPSHWDKRQVPKGPDGLPRPGQPETQQLSRWLKDFSSHTTLSRVGRGASPLASL